MGQYFDKEPHSVSNVFSFSYYHQEKVFTFSSDSGVFSKKQVDFGTHVLLKAISQLSFSKGLDIGCGIGVIGICLAKDHPDSHIDMVDINIRAVQLAKDNLIKNNIKNCTVIESNLYEAVPNQYDLIVSNPPIRAGKKVVHQIIEEACQHLNDNGMVVVVIQKKQGALPLYKKMEEVFLNATVLTKEKGYFVIIGTKRPK